MSLLDSLRDSLASMGFLQLALAFVALLAYSLALAVALTPIVRVGAIGTALAAAALFTLATPRWMDGFVLMAMAVVACGAFAGLTWLIAQALGVGTARGRDMPELADAVAVIQPEASSPAPLARQPRAVAVHTS